MITSHSKYVSLFVSLDYIGSFLYLQTAKIGSLVDVQESEDPEGLRVFYYLVQDLRASHPSIRYGLFH
jgi:hypothetical protein